MALDERAFFNERPEQRNGRYSCPRCKRTNDYQMRWMRRTRKDRVPPNADETDRAKFLKLRDHLIRVDDELTCKTCGKRFEIPSMHSLVFVDQIEGLPKVDDEEDEPVAPPSTAPAPSASAPAGSTPNTPAPRQRKGYAPPKAWR
jgi:DNA-directed RNA polymerase subunit RPC12/RpoP